MKSTTVSARAISAVPPTGASLIAIAAFFMGRWAAAEQDGGKSPWTKFEVRIQLDIGGSVTQLLILMCKHQEEPMWSVQPQFSWLQSSIIYRHNVCTGLLYLKDMLIAINISMTHNL